MFGLFRSKLEKQLDAYRPYCDEVQLEGLRVYLSSLATSGRKGYHVSSIDKGPLKESEIAAGKIYADL